MPVYGSSLVTIPRAAQGTSSGTGNWSTRLAWAQLEPLLAPRATVTLPDLRELTAADSGAATEAATVAVEVTTADALATLSETATPQVSHDLQDTGAHAEASVLGSVLIASDAGGATETASVEQVSFLSAGDSGGGVDGASVGAAQLAQEAGVGAEAGALAGLLAAADLGTAIDTAALDRALFSADQGSASEAAVRAEAVIVVVQLRASYAPTVTGKASPAAVPVLVGRYDLAGYEVARYDPLVLLPARAA